VTRLVFLVLPSAYSQDPCADFHDQYVKWRRFAPGMCLWDRALWENLAYICGKTRRIFVWSARKLSFLSTLFSNIEHL